MMRNLFGFFFLSSLGNKCHVLVPSKTKESFHLIAQQRVRGREGDEGRLVYYSLEFFEI